MFGSAVLEAALGLVFVYLIFSTIGTAMVEALNAATNCRGMLLRKWVEQVLGPKAADEFYDSPLISSLRKPHFWKRYTFPSYIPEPTFAESLAYFLAGGQYTTNPKDVVSGAQKLGGAAKSQAGAVVSLLAQKSGSDFSVFLAEVAKWFKESQDRVSGRFKVTSLTWLLVLGFVIAMVCNVDTVQIADSLYRQTKLRQDVAASAGTVIDPASFAIADKMEKLEDEGLIGWGKEGFWSFWVNWKHRTTMHLTKLLGCLLTALAISLGAPFWFEVLNKMNQTVRATGLKPSTDAPIAGLPSPPQPAIINPAIPPPPPIPAAEPVELPPRNIQPVEE